MSKSPPIPLTVSNVHPLGLAKRAWQWEVCSGERCGISANGRSSLRNKAAFFKFFQRSVNRNRINHTAWVALRWTPDGRGEADRKKHEVVQWRKRQKPTETHCCGHIVADTNVSPFAHARNMHLLQTQILCPGHKNCFWFCSETFCVRKKYFPVCRPKKHHEHQCVRNNVSSFARANKLNNNYSMSPSWIWSDKITNVQRARSASWL